MDYASAVGKAREGNETKRRGEFLYKQSWFKMTSVSPSTSAKNIAHWITHQRLEKHVKTTKQSVGAKRSFSHSCRLDSSVETWRLPGRPPLRQKIRVGCQPTRLRESLRWGQKYIYIYRNGTHLLRVCDRGHRRLLFHVLRHCSSVLPFVVATAPPIVLAVVPSSRPLVNNFSPFLSSPSSSLALVGAIAGAGSCGRQRLTSRAPELQFLLTTSPSRSARRSSHQRRTRRSGSAMRCARHRGHRHSWCTATW
jgi:hypothetical protein